MLFCQDAYLGNGFSDFIVISHVYNTLCILKRLAHYTNAKIGRSICF